MSNLRQISSGVRATYNVTEGTPEMAIQVQRANDLATVYQLPFGTTDRSFN